LSSQPFNSACTRSDPRRYSRNESPPSGLLDRGNLGAQRLRRGAHHRGYRRARRDVSVFRVKDGSQIPEYHLPGFAERHIDDRGIAAVTANQ